MSRLVDKNYTYIKERVLQLAEIKGVAKEKFLESIDMTYGSFKGAAKKGTLNSDAIDKLLTNYPDVNPDWLVTGRGEILRPSVEVITPEPSKDVTILTNYNPSSALIPFYDVDFIAGTAFSTVEDRAAKPDYFMDIPSFRGCTAFRAYSDSMESLIRSGAILFGTKVESWFEHLEYGQVYGIVCTDGRKYLKYIKKYRKNPEEYFLLESENKFYDEFELPKAHIQSIWLIHGHLSKRI